MQVKSYSLSVTVWELQLDGLGECRHCPSGLGDGNNRNQHSQLHCMYIRDPAMQQV